MIKGAFTDPPWIAFPLVKRGDREAPPEFFEYGEQWSAQFFALSPADRESYVAKYPEPKGWLGFYESIRGPI